jgi:hypothetical protein
MSHNAGTKKLKQIISHAKELRKEHPQKYGVPGAKPHHKGHVKDGWKHAIKQAARDLHK